MTKLKMKKLKEASLLLAVMVVLTACGNKENAVKGMDDLKTEIGGSSAETGQDSTGQGAGNNKGEKDGETSQDSAQGNVGAPVLVVTEWSDNRYTDDGKLLVEGDFQGAEVSGEGYEAVAEAVKNYFTEKEQAFRESMDLYEEAAVFETGYTEDFRGFSSSVESSGTRVDSSIISIKSFHYDFTGGVHGNYGTVGATFDAKTGARLSFWDLAADKDAFGEATLNSCLEQVTAEYGEGLYIDYEETIRNVWAEEPNWYLDGAGIRVIFTPYEIAPYAMGEANVLLPYGEFADLLKAEYQMGAVAGVAVLPEGAAAQVCLGDKADEKQTVQIIAENTTGTTDTGFRKIRLEAGGNSQYVAELDRLVSIYLIQRADGRDFLLFDGDMGSDDFFTFVYEITNGEIKKVQEMPMGTSIRPGTVTLQGAKVSTRVDALGTYSAYTDYRMNENGTLEQAGEWMTIETMYESQILTVIKDLPVVVDGKATVLPQGSQIRITGTNDKDILEYQTLEGELKGEIHYTRGEKGWPVYIDGVSEDEYFENLPYAG